MSIVEIANQVKLVSLGSLVVIVAIIVKMVERKKVIAWWTSSGTI